MLNKSEDDVNEDLSLEDKSSNNLSKAEERVDAVCETTTTTSKNKTEKRKIVNSIVTPNAEGNGQGDGGSQIDDTNSASICNHIKEKLIFVVSVVCLITIAYGLLQYQFIIPYFYAILAPMLIAHRLFFYWKLKWQLFLVDFCYFANALTYIFIWAILNNGLVFVINFSLTNGPLVGAVIVYRNSLVFHDLDKMTSVFIHLVPAYLTYCIRWYPLTTAMYWYSSFLEKFPEPSYIYLLAVPLACFMGHTLFFFIVVHLVLKPGEEYLNSYRYLTGKEGSIIHKLINIFNRKFHLVIYHVCNCLFCIAWLLVANFCYEYFLLHTVYLLLATLVTIWNGACYYIDVFSKKGLNDPPS